MTSSIRSPAGHHRPVGADPARHGCGPVAPNHDVRAARKWRTRQRRQRHCEGRRQRDHTAHTRPRHDEDLRDRRRLLAGSDARRQHPRQERERIHPDDPHQITVASSQANRRANAASRTDTTSTASREPCTSSYLLSLDSMLGEIARAHLRMCMTCGHIGCCDSSPHQHASEHFRETGHPVMRSVEPGEDWRWCYIDVRLG